MMVGAALVAAGIFLGVAVMIYSLCWMAAEADSRASKKHYSRKG